MAFAKFEGYRFRIDGEIAENHAILVNLTASIDMLVSSFLLFYTSNIICVFFVCVPMCPILILCIILLFLST